MKKSLLVATLFASQLVAAQVSAEEAIPNENQNANTEMAAPQEKPAEAPKLDSAKRMEVLALIEKAELTDEQKGSLAVEADMAETQADLDKVVAKIKEMAAPKETPKEEKPVVKPVDSAKRVDLLKAIDASKLTDEQKGKLAQKVDAAVTEEDLNKVVAELKEMTTPKETPKAKADSAKRVDLLKAIDASKLTDEQKEELALKADKAETQEDLEKVAAEFKKMTAPKAEMKSDAELRDELLKLIDGSELTPEQKGKLAEEVSFAKDRKELDKVAEKVRKMVKPAEVKPDAKKSDAELRDELLKLIDGSNLTDEQKGKLAEEVSFAKDRAELDKVAEKVRKMVAAKPAAKKADDKKVAAKPAEKATKEAAAKKATLPNTGETTTLGALALATLSVVAGAVLVAPRFKKEN
ncbi:LPXTG cell wall anchor domain-containing protein [Tuanshanicoccus lijuaniae]|uniref:LPXTG cell wall anchor domain-containing protein n=1 Tax=Aerococcaceae bacterium zg-1292 TaxID=2774330 RepID=UPI0019378306|nr:LPXTG cell wall anchor domain-containing protein [Aerococcaceae bacterium zg-1292]QQA37353.1 LPXTG cell wall anchor domain-containing protein [Aerococcaceae bacterium zg-1292]